MRTISENLHAWNVWYDWSGEGEETFESWRAKSMTTELFRNYCERAGLKCVSPNSRWDESDVMFQVNDGESLAAVPDNSIDFVFSFDSLVHAEKIACIV
jgi:hypothetical protein